MEPDRGSVSAGDAAGLGPLHPRCRHVQRIELMGARDEKAVPLGAPEGEVRDVLREADAAERVAVVMDRDAKVPGQAFDPARGARPLPLEAARIAALRAIADPWQRRLEARCGD